MYEWFTRSLEHVRDGTGDRFEPIIPLIAGPTIPGRGNTRIYGRPTGGLSRTGRRSTGSGGRVMATAFKIPFDVVKQRLEVQGALRLKNDQNAYKGIRISRSNT